MSLLDTDLFFIIDNLKVHPFILQDRPVEGFEVVHWNSWTLGTLWHLEAPDNVGYTPNGNLKVYGQVWQLVDNKSLSLLERYCGLTTGLVAPTKIKAHIPDDNKIREIDTVVFKLNNIKSTYKKLEHGRWRF